MLRLRSVMVPVFWALTIALLVAAVALAAFHAPIESSMGPVQKIFYLHLPVAFNMFFACLVVFVASLGYVWQRRMWWDDLAHGAAQVAVVFCSVVLLTGMIWARSAWGSWWTWSPRLTFSLVLWLLYVVYLVLRTSIDSAQRRALVCALYGVVAFLDVPLVYLSVKLLPDIHPSSVELAPAMRQTLAFWFVPVTLLCAGLVWTRFSLNVRARRLSRPGGPETDTGVPMGLSERRA